jgi:hypothetical protein
VVGLNLKNVSIETGRYNVELSLSLFTNLINQKIDKMRDFTEPGNELKSMLAFLANNIFNESDLVHALGGYNAMSNIQKGTLFKARLREILNTKQVLDRKPRFYVERFESVMGPKYLIIPFDSITTNNLARIANYQNIFVEKIKEAGNLLKNPETKNMIKELQLGRLNLMDELRPLVDSLPEITANMGRYLLLHSYFYRSKDVLEKIFTQGVSAQKIIQDLQHNAAELGSSVQFFYGNKTLAQSQKISQNFYQSLFPDDSDETKSFVIEYVLKLKNQINSRDSNLPLELQEFYKNIYYTDNGVFKLKEQTVDMVGSMSNFSQPSAPAQRMAKMIERAQSEEIKKESPAPSINPFRFVSDAVRKFTTDLVNTEPPKIDTKTVKLKPQEILKNDLMANNFGNIMPSYKVFAESLHRRDYLVKMDPQHLSALIKDMVKNANGLYQKQMYFDDLVRLQNTVLDLISTLRKQTDIKEFEKIEQIILSVADETKTTRAQFVIAAVASISGELSDAGTQKSWQKERLKTLELKINNKLQEKRKLDKVNYPELNAPARGLVFEGRG